ncbi:MAG: VWA domain-containing protein [Tepidiformaceae bacterium]
MSELTLANPWVLAMLPLAPLGLALWWAGTRRALGRTQRVSRDTGSAPPYLAAILLSLAAVAAVGAAAQPRWGTRVSRIPRSGADLVVVIDVSRSMDARDVAPSRLEAAKTTIDSVLDRLGGDRFGLVVFGGDARVRFPLTTDFAAARQVVNSLQTGTILVEGGTSAALGLEQAVSLLDESRDSGKVILLLTDGDDLGGDPAAAAERVRASGADLFVAGVGTADGATIPVVDLATGVETEKLDGAGAPIISTLQEPFLRALAIGSNGRYLGSDLSVVPGAVDGRLRALERSRIDERPTILPVERYRVFAAAALGLLVLAALAERFGRFPRRFVAGTALAMLAIVLGGCASESYQANEDGRTAMERGDFKLAVEKFTEAQVNKPDDPQIALNLASAYSAAELHTEAISAARRALASNNNRVRARAYSNIGHQQFALERYPEALDAFRRALLDDPADDDARHDYEVVLRLLSAPPSEESSGPPGLDTQQPTPAPDDSTTPGPGAPGDSPATPGGASTPTPDATGTPGPGASPDSPSRIAELNDEIGQINAQIERLLQVAGDTPTPQQALEILRLLAERTNRASERDALDGGGDPRDY